MGRRKVSGLTIGEDGILATEAASNDLSIEYVLVGATVADGLLGWISFAVNTPHRTARSSSRLGISTRWSCGYVADGPRYLP